MHVLMGPSFCRLRFFFGRRISTTWTVIAARRCRDRLNSTQRHLCIKLLSLLSNVTLFATFEVRHFHGAAAFLRATAVPAGTAEARISYGNSVCPSVCLSVCLSQPGGIPSPGEIETPGLYHMIA